MLDDNFDEFKHVVHLERDSFYSNTIPGWSSVCPPSYLTRLFGGCILTISLRHAGNELVMQLINSLEGDLHRACRVDFSFFKEGSDASNGHWLGNKPYLENMSCVRDRYDPLFVRLEVYPGVSLVMDVRISIHSSSYHEGGWNMGLESYMGLNMV